MYPLSSTMRIIKSKWMRLARQVVGMGLKTYILGCCINLKERGHLEVLGVDVKISRKLDIRQ